MSPSEILKLLKERPFVGLRFSISDGREYEVRHPDMVLVTARQIHISLPPIVDGVPTGENIYIDPLHVTSLEPLPARKNGRNGKSKGR